MILIIDNYDSFTYNLYQAIALQYHKVCVMRNDAITIDEIRDMSPAGIIISPGPGRPENAGICVDLVRAIVNREMPVIPILGVCLGHQIITIALGGHVVSAKHIFHGKQDFIFHDQNGIYKSLSQPFAAGRYHSLVSERDSLPSNLVVTAENHDKVIMGIKHIELPIYGLQFHPESILTPEGGTLLNAFVGICQSSIPTGAAA